MVEANPAIETFTERPARVADEGSAVIDFWVRPRDATTGEFWLIERRRAEDGTKPEPDEPLVETNTLHGLPVRVIHQSELQTLSVPIANWSRIVPYLVSYRQFRVPVLEEAIVVYLNQPRALDAILERFSDHDPASVEASLFALLASGRVVSPDLVVAALSGKTSFQTA